ncbi:MAG: hypothetical protein BroJett040_20430 [Oligoflexia bacterium]|nr:MAG: hypothetical protein BroJett040_20430 [Oligoflexia bacterium]
MKKQTGESEPQWWMDIDPLAEIEQKADNKKVIETLEKYDQGQIQFSDDFFDQMHDRIMSEISKEEVQIQEQPLLERYRKKIHQAFTMMASLVVIMIAAETQTRMAEINVRETVEIAQALGNSSARFEHSLLTHQNPDDFFVDLGEESLNHLTQEQIHNLVADESQN